MKMEERLPDFKIICRAKDSFNAQRHSAVYKQWMGFAYQESATQERMSHQVMHNNFIESIQNTNN